MFTLTKIDIASFSFISANKLQITISCDI